MKRLLCSALFLLVAALAFSEGFADLLLRAYAGQAEAQNKLGVMYATGDGLTEDRKEAAQWFFKAAVQGHAKAQNNLGNAYYSGNGVQRDLAESVKWYRNSADQGYADAQYNLGYAYYAGEGVERSTIEAAKWMTKAADQGSVDAGYLLATFYENGTGVGKDTSRAIRIYNLLADRGHARAQYALGHILEYGAGGAVPKNLVNAHAWYSIAADSAAAQNDLEFKDYVLKSRKLLEVEMSDYQIKQAGQIAIEWRFMHSK